MTSPHRWIRRRVRAGVVVPALMLGGVAAVAPAAPAAAAPRPVEGGSLDWGVRQSFRTYITGSIAKGSITTADGATKNSNGTFRFPGVATGTADPGAETIDATFSGSVHFTGHGGLLDMTMDDIRIARDGDNGVLVADVVTLPLDETEPVTYDDVAFADLDFSAVASTGPAAHPTWTAVPVTLSAAGAEAFAGFYVAGDPLDPITFTLDLGSPPGPPGDARYVGLTPRRILDSRDGTGTNKAKWGDGQSRDVVVAGGTTTVPDDAVAVVLNLTGVLPSAGTHLTAWPAGTPMPEASSLNLPAGSIRPNLVTVRVGTNRSIAIFNNDGTLDVLADVVGYYVTDETTLTGAGGSGAGVGGAAVDASGRFTGITPTRVLDSREPSPGTPWGPAQTKSVVVTGGATNVPVDAEAVVINMTVTGASETSHLRVWPTGQPKPDASNLNFGPNEAVPNLVIVKVGAGGAIDVYNSSGTVHVIGDIVGSFGGTGSRFASVSPERVLDSRDGVGVSKARWGAGETRFLTVAKGVVPTNATAVVLNVTGVMPSATTHIRVWPHGVTKPDASNLNLPPGDVRANLVIVKVGTDGKIDLYNNSGTVDLIADLVGYVT